MDCILVIDRDRVATADTGLAVLERDVRVATVDTVSEGVRVLLSHQVSLIVVDVALLHQSPAEHAAVFERVAPGVPVMVVVRPETTSAARVALEEHGFSLVAPVAVGAAAS